MEITPRLPDGYSGPVKYGTCRICRHLFAVTEAEDERVPTRVYCHECSQILVAELAQVQASQRTTPLPLRSTPASTSSTAPLHLPAHGLPPIRTIDREKMTVQQLLKEAHLLQKTWRSQDALASYDQALQCDPTCLEASLGRGDVLRSLHRPHEALLAYHEALRLDARSTRAACGQGSTLRSLHRDEEALAAFQLALQYDTTCAAAYHGTPRLFWQKH